MSTLHESEEVGQGSSKSFTYTEKVSYVGLVDFIWNVPKEEPWSAFSVTRLQRNVPGGQSSQAAFAICPDMRWPPWLHMIPDMGYTPGLGC